MPRRSDGATIQQIVDAADKIMRRSQSLSYDQFLEDDEKQDALIRPLEIMGEAVSRVSVAFRTTNPDLMPWSTVKAVRNLLIHGYDTVDLDISLDYWPMWQRGDGMQRTNIYLDEDQLRLLKHLAAEESTSVADLVRQAVDQFLRSR